MGSIKSIIAFYVIAYLESDNPYIIETLWMLATPSDLFLSLRFQKQ